MAIHSVIKISYVGTILTDIITTGPWNSVTAIYPEHGGLPYKPQFHVDVLQPINTDGARYRIGGSHFPRFTLMAIIPAVDYISAQIVARELELLQGEPITIESDGMNPVRCWVIGVRAVASGKRVIGATAKGASQAVPGGGAYEQEAFASIDVAFSLQAVPE